MKRVKPAPVTPYEVTHLSARDGSPAMLLSVYNGHSYVLMNENGDIWTDPAVEWRPVVDFFR